jgi:hypothetical protein
MKFLKVIIISGLLPNWPQIVAYRMGIFEAFRADLRLESVPAATAALERTVKTKIMLGALVVMLGTAFGMAH